MEFIAFSWVGGSGLPGFCSVSGPGLGPAADLLFFASPKKRRQKKGDPTGCDPSRTGVRPGQPAVLAPGVRRITHFALYALRSNKCGELEDEACVSFGTQATPVAALLGAS